MRRIATEKKGGNAVNLEQRKQREMTCGDGQVWLLPHGRLQLRGDGSTPMDGLPHLLPLLLSSYVSGGGNGEGSPSG
jgi:hypothetical protein